MPVMGDFDNNGQVELVIQRRDTADYETGFDSIFVFRNVGTSWQPNWVRINSFYNMPTWSIVAPRFVDWENDGDWDIIAWSWGEYPWTCNLYRNAGSIDSAFWQYDSLVSAALPVAYNYPQFEASDLNNDGVIDIIRLWLEFDNPLYILDIFLNNGSSENPDFSINHSRLIECREAGIHPFLCCGDIDGDWDKDLILGLREKSVLTIPNIGTMYIPNYRAPVVWLGPIHNHGDDLALWDHQADGIFDIAQTFTLSNYFMWPDYYVYWMAFINEGAMGAPDFRPFSILPHLYNGMGFGLNGSLSPTSGDINRDGLPDLAYERYGLLGAAFAIGETSYSLNSSCFQQLNDAGPNHYPELVDLDSDGDLDMIVRNQWGLLQSYENIGGGNPQWSPNPALIRGIERDVNIRVRKAKLNDDALVDFVGQTAGSFRAYINMGTPSAPFFSYDPSVFADYTGPVLVYSDLADLDGDGDDDLVVNDHCILTAVENLSETGIGDVIPALPNSLNLSCYPNPFNSSTAFEYGIDNAGAVKLEIFDILGRQVETLVDESRQPGVYRAVWEAGDNPSGIYFARLQIADKSRTLKLTLAK